MLVTQTSLTLLPAIFRAAAVPRRRPGVGLVGACHLFAGPFCVSTRLGAIL